MPGPRIRTYAKPKKCTIKRLVKSLWKHFKFEIIISLITLIISIVINLCGSVFASLITQLLTEAVPQKIYDPSVSIMTGSFHVNILFLKDVPVNLTGLLIALIIIYGVGVICSWTWTRTMAIVTQKYLNIFRNKMFSHMQKLPIKYFDTHQNGAIMSLYTNDIDTIRQLVSQSLPNVVSTGVTVIGCLTVMMFLSIWMTLVVIAGTIAMMLNTKIIGGRASRFFVEQQKSVGKVEGAIEESITGLKVIKVFTHEEDSLKDFEKVNDELYENASIANIHGNIMMPINGNIGNFIYILCAIVGAILYFVPDAPNVSLTGIDTISIGIILSFLSISRGFTNNVNNVSQNLTSVVGGMAGTARILALLDEKEETDSGYVSLVHIKYNEDGTY